MSTVNEERRCQVGLHNYVFFKNAQSKDQSKECLRCKTCNFLLLPSSIEPRVCYVHDEGQNTNKK